MKGSELKKRVCRLMWLYFFITFTFGFGHAFFFSTYSIYLMSKGLDLLQINVVNCVFMASVFLLEIPTGAYADLFGRKRSFVTSCFVYGLAMIIYWQADSFWICIVAELFAALGAALHSGAMEAWIVDSMRIAGHRGGLRTLFRREHYVSQVGIVGGSLLGAYIAQYDLSLPWLVAGVSMILVGIFASYAMQETPITARKTLSGFASIGLITRDSITYGVRHKGVLYIILFGSVCALCVQTMNMQWQIRFMQDFSFNPRHLGWTFVGISLFIMIGNRLSTKLSSRFGKGRRAIVLSQCFTAGGIIAAGWFTSVAPVLIAFYVHEMGRGMFAPLKRAYMNERIPSATRATILSFDSMVAHSGAFLGLLGSGLIAKHWSIATSWMTSGLLLIVAIPVFLFLKNGDGNK